MHDLIVTVSGLRGVVGESLTPSVARQYVAAFAAGLPPGSVVIARDGRPSGDELARAITAVLVAGGRHVIDAGAAATPTTGVLVRHHCAVGGVQVTASHNPSEYNGIKLFSAEGRVICAAAGRAVLERYRQSATVTTTAGKSGEARTCDDPLGPHLSLVEKIIDVEAIKTRRFHVLLDANHGAGGALGRRLLEELGCRVTVLGGQPDGRYDHPPEPTAENLAGVLAEVVSVGADVGFCQDPDADRLAVIDRRGRYLGEEYTLAMCVDHVLRSIRGPVVTNCSTSRMSEDLAGRYGVPFFRSAVGEANVVDLMLETGAVIGGEGNGGVIDPRAVMIRDSFTGMALVLGAMAARQVPVSHLAAGLPHYGIVKTKIALAPERPAAALDAVERHFGDAAPDRLDGLRLDWPNKWLLVRPSNTEPIVRAIAEAKTTAEAATLCQTAARVISAA